jgi:hypothetical protein
METPSPAPEQTRPDLAAQLIVMQRQLNDINTKISFVLEETQKAARARQVAFWLTVVFFLAPLVAIVLMIPTLMGQLNSILGGI